MIFSFYTRFSATSRKKSCKKEKKLQEEGRFRGRFEATRAGEGILSCTLLVYTYLSALKDASSARI